MRLPTSFTSPASSPVSSLNSQPLRLWIGHLSPAIYQPVPGKQTPKGRAKSRRAGRPALQSYGKPAKLTAEHVSHDLLGPVKILITPGWRKPFL